MALADHVCMMHALCWISNDLLNSSVLVIGTSISDSPVSARRNEK